MYCEICDAKISSDDFGPCKKCGHENKHVEWKPGWYALGSNVNVVRFWDGRSWIGSPKIETDDSLDVEALLKSLSDNHLEYAYEDDFYESKWSRNLSNRRLLLVMVLSLMLISIVLVWNTSKTSKIELSGAIVASRIQNGSHGDFYNISCPTIKISVGESFKCVATKRARWMQWPTHNVQLTVTVLNDQLALNWIDN